MRDGARVSQAHRGGGPRPHGPGHTARTISSALLTAVWCARTCSSASLARSSALSMPASVAILCARMLTRACESLPRRRERAVRRVSMLACGKQCARAVLRPNARGRGGGGKPTQRARGHTRGARHATPRSAHARTHALEEVSARREECGAAHEHAQRLLLEQVADVPAGHLRRRRRQRSCNQHAAAPPRARPKSGGGARRMTAAGQADYVTMRWLSGWRRPVAGLPLRCAGCCAALAAW